MTKTAQFLSLEGISKIRVCVQQRNRENIRDNEALKNRRKATRRDIDFRNNDHPYILLMPGSPPGGGASSSCTREQRIDGDEKFLAVGNKK